MIALPPQLAALSIGQKLAGVGLSLLLWLAPAGIVWLHMHGQLDAKYELGKADCRTENAEAIATANQDALDKWKRESSDVLAQSKKDAALIDSNLASSLKRIETATKGYQDYAKAHPLPAGCSADDNRVRMFNEARRSD